MKALPWGRIILGVSAAIFLGFSCFCFVMAVKWHIEAKRAEKATLAELKADLSKTGRYKFRFENDFPFAHDEVLRITAEPNFGEEYDYDEVMKGIAGQIVITEPNEALYKSLAIDANSFVADFNWGEPNLSYPAIKLYYIKCGRYNAELTIDKGAAVLEGRKQILTVRHKFCGLEFMPAYMGYFFGVVSAIPGLISGIILVIKSMKKPGGE
jgi:hypothetical protein